MIRDLPAIRAALGLTTGGLAQLLGVDIRTVQRYLAGEREVPEPTWRLLNVAMNDRGVFMTLVRWSKPPA